MGVGDGVPVGSGFGGTGVHDESSPVMFTCRWARVPEGANLKVNVWVPVGAEQPPGSVTSTFALPSATAPPGTATRPPPAC